MLLVDVVADVAVAVVVVAVVVVVVHQLSQVYRRILTAFVVGVLWSPALLL